MKKKRILYIHHGKGLGGAPLSLLYLIEGLDTSKYHPMVLFLHQSEVVDLYWQKGIEVVGVVGLSDFSHTTPQWYRWYQVHHIIRSWLDTFRSALWVAPRWLKKIAPDVVHLNTSSLIAWAYAAHQLKVTVVIHIREPLARGYVGFRRWFVQRLVARCADVIIPISDNDAIPWKHQKNVTVLYNPVDTKLFSPRTTSPYPLRGVADDVPVILFVGGLSEHKGTHVILEAFAQILNKTLDAHLVIAGSFGSLDEVSRFSLRYWTAHSYFTRRVARAYEAVKKSVTLFGVTHNIPALMARSSVVVFPSTTPHFARPIIEAGCMERPVVASLLPPLDEIIVHGVNGFLVSPNDTKRWASYLERILCDEPMRIRMGRDAYDLAIQRFSRDTYVRAITACYGDLLVSARV